MNQWLISSQWRWVSNVYASWKRFDFQQRGASHVVMSSEGKCRDIEGDLRARGTKAEMYNLPIHVRNDEAE